MIKYDEFLVLNEAVKKEEIKEGDYVICDKNFRGVQQLNGKLAIVETITDVDKITFYTIKVQKPDDPENKLRDYQWMPYHKYRLTDTFTITKSQGRSLIKITPEEAKDFLRGNLVEFDCSKFIKDILAELKFKIKKKYIDICFVNVDFEKSDLISFVPISKFKSEIKNKAVDPYKASFRQTMKIGKFFRKLDPDLTDKEIDALIPQFKLLWEKTIKNVEDNLKVVVGEDIRKWYLGTTYGKGETGHQGSIGGSCMRSSRSQKRFDIYCENPDKCAMGILTDDKGMLMARVLIWKLDDGTVYMDRIYSVDNTSELKMVEYCKKNNMIGPWVRDRNGVKRVTVKRDYGVPQNNPFMDTFKYFNRDTNQLLTPDALNIDYKAKSFQYYNYVDHD